MLQAVTVDSSGEKQGLVQGEDELEEPQRRSLAVVTMEYLLVRRRSEAVVHRKLGWSRKRGGLKAAFLCRQAVLEVQMVTFQQGALKLEDP